MVINRDGTRERMMFKRMGKTKGEISGKGMKERRRRERTNFGSREG